jgi:FtsX-like permease family/Peptidase family M28
MKKTVYIVAWTLVAVVGFVAQFHVARWLTETEKDPLLAETAQLTPEMYPEIAARITPEGLDAHIKALSSIPSRFTGTSGGREAADYVKAEFRALGVGEPEEAEFPVTVPVSERAEIHTGDTVYPMHPLYPNGVCPAGLPEDGLSTRLVYAGFGRLSDVEGKELDGATVVVETGAREQWLFLIDLGARAIVFVERERPPRAMGQFTQTLSHQNVPRFWMTRAEAAPLLGRLKQNDIGATLYSDARWEERRGVNVWVDIPGVSDAPHNVEEVVVLSAYYDSSSFTPGLAPGAEQACGIAALLELGKVIRDHPFEKRVRLLATSGHFQAMEGARRYVWENVGQFDSAMRDVSPQEHAAFFALDLSSNAERVGLFFGGHFFAQLANNLKPRLSDLGHRARRYVEGDEARGITGIAEVLDWDPGVAFVDTINPTVGKDWPNYMPAPLALEHEAALLAGIPALSFVTTNDTRFFVGTPTDTQVNLENLAQQTRLLACLLPNAFNVEGRYLKRSLPRSICRIKGRAVYFNPQESYLPDSSVPNALVVSRRQGDGQPFLAGVSTHSFVTADEEGNFELVGMGTTQEVPPLLANLAFEPFVLEGAQITWAPDFGQWGKTSYPIVLTPVQKEMKLVCVAFRCKTLEIYNLFDPRNSNYLVSINALEAASNSVPPIYGTTFVDATWPSFMAPTATLYAPANTLLKVTASAGPMQKRMVLLNVPEEAPAGGGPSIGDGFNVDDTPSIRRTYLQSARDMWRLNESRISFFGEHGIANDRVSQLHEAAGGALAKAQEALDAKQYQKYSTEARRALSLESRAYPDVVGMANDTIRGLIFYLALLLPFAFTMERLFLTGRRIETRIAGTLAFFMAMFVVLRFTHPGFKIVLSPMVVLLGFSVATLSSVVISIVMGKLETLVSKRKVEQEGEHESGVQAISGFTIALEMGIANMRRRKARTVLTSITLVLLTFSVLSFASVTAQIRLQKYPYAEGATPYKGALLRTKNWAPFPFETYASLRNELEDLCTLAPRRWYYGHLTLNQSSIDIQHGGVIRSLRAVIGLTPQERKCMDVASALIGDSRWLTPATPGEEAPAEILVPLNLARDFTVERGAETDGMSDEALVNAFVGTRVGLLGREFTVVGVFDWETMNRLVDIDGESLTPFDPVEMEKKAQEEGVPDPEEVQRYIHHSFKDVAITSERLLGDMGGAAAAVRSVAIVPNEPSMLEGLVESLVRRMDYILFVNLNGESTLMSSRDSTRISDLWNLVILMAIAGLIVFNTMLGSVYERTKEIGTYTALGIAPSHIGRLFMVEACVFAIIGAMAGYVLGQTVAQLVHVIDLPVLSALNLNYSSLAGVGACIVVMAMVLGSTYYPSRKASEIGVPDIERRWKLPATKEAAITLDLPFTVSPPDAQGLVMFLKEYLDSHVDVSVGNFYVENVRAGSAVAGGKGTGVTGQFWLTPFDLGVSQYTTFTMRMIENMDVCGVQVRIERLSGDAGSWRRANGHFMTDMRGQFLIWRNLSPEARADYVERGKEYAPE